MPRCTRVLRRGGHARCSACVRCNHVGPAKLIDADRRQMPPNGRDQPWRIGPLRRFDNQQRDRLDALQTPGGPRELGPLQEAQRGERLQRIVDEQCSQTVIVRPAGGEVR